MKTVLILGAGRSSSSLIRYVLQHASANEWNVIVGDLSVEAGRQSIGSGNGAAVYFDIKDEVSSAITVGESDIVISLLPAHLHPLVARLCVS